MTALTTTERRLAAAVLVVAPLAGFLGGLLAQDYGGEMSQELTYIAEHDTRWLLANYSTLAMGALMTMAIGILIALVRRRARVWGYLGGALAIVGLYFHGAVVGYSLVQAPLVDSALPDQDVLAFTGGLMYEHRAFNGILLPFLAFFLGMVLLAVALRRARVVPLWIAAVIAAAPLTEFVGVRAFSPELMFVLFAVGFGHIALHLSREQADVPPAGAVVPDQTSGEPLAAAKP